MENIATIFIVEGAKNLVSKANNREQKMVKLIVARCLGVMSNPQLGIFTHMASSHVNLLVRNKISKQAKNEGVYIKKVVHLPKDLFGKSTWPPFHCSETPIWQSCEHTLHEVQNNAIFLSQLM